MNRFIISIAIISMLLDCQFLQAQNGTVKTTTTINRTNSGLNVNTRSLGVSSVVIGDLDGDGISELAVGCARIDIDGVVLILFMNANGTVKKHTVLGRNTGGVNINGLSSFGSSIAYLGDVNYDGIGDILVGDASYPPNAWGAGVIIYLDSSGLAKGTKLLSANLLFTLTNNAYMGQGSSTAGDLDGDGNTDIVLGIPRDPATASNSGSCRILFLDSAQGFKSFVTIRPGFNGFTTNSTNIFNFGSAIAHLGSFGPDTSLTAFAIGAPGSFYTDFAQGAVYIVWVDKNGVVKKNTPITQVELGNDSLVRNGYFGSHIAKIGDLDGDGMPEIAVGANLDTTAGVGRGGSVRILFFNANGTLKTIQKINNQEGGFTIPIEDEEYFGHVGTLGDFDGDKVPDLIVASPLKNNLNGVLYLLTLNGVPVVSTRYAAVPKQVLGLYPNPANQRVFIQSPHPVLQLHLYNASGKLIEQLPPNETIEVSHLTPGVYVLHVHTQQGVTVKKIIKE